MAVRCSLSLALIGALAAASAEAQTSATLDASGTHFASDGTDGTGAFIVAPAVRLDRASMSLDAGGTLSSFGAGLWSAQLGVTGSYFTPPFGALQGELSASLDATAQSQTPGTGAGSGGARLHLLGESHGLWFGAEAGHASDGIDGRATVAGDFGVWFRRGVTSAVARVMPSAVGGGLRYVDTEAAARLERGRLELSASIGLRTWHKPSGAPATMWGALNGAVWIADHLAVSIGGGSYAADPSQGFPRGSYVSLGLRLATHRPTSRQALSTATQRTLPPTVLPAPNAFTVRPAAAGEWTLEVLAADADQVEVMGDFTDWRVVPLRRRADGRWAATIAIPAGTHRMNLRVDGGAWGTPQGLPVLTDEFSGTVALLTIQ